MTLRLADITARIAGIRQLGGVVNAMRGIAAARAQQARAQLLAVDTYEAAIAEGLGSALSLIPAASEAAADLACPALIVFAAEQGFAGPFSERVFDFAGPDLAGSVLFLVGARGAILVAERGVTPSWSGALPAHSAGIPKLAEQMSEVLYARIAQGGIEQLDVIFTTSEPGNLPAMQRTRLLPLDPSRFPDVTNQVAPLLSLPPAELVAGLTADYLHAELCRAALHAFASENEARMAAMAAARDQIGRQLTALGAQEHQVRQEEITAEVIELAAGAAASRSH